MGCGCVIYRIRRFDRIFPSKRLCSLSPSLDEVHERIDITLQKEKHYIPFNLLALFLQPALNMNGVVCSLANTYSL